jgi:hypothetical protein
MRITLAAVLAILLVFPKCGWTQDDKSAAKQPDSNNEKGKVPSVWMKVKLKSTENILRGLTLGDFDLVEENALRMNAFSRLEQVVHGRDAEYQTQLKFFSHANQELARQAKKKNLEGATLAFVQLTTSCFNCHRAVRDHKDDAGPSKPTWTHVLKKDTAFYLNGPQQGRPADGQLVKGAKVQLIKDAGSYCQVRTEDGRTAYVARDAMKTMRQKKAKPAKKKTPN